MVNDRRWAGDRQRVFWGQPATRADVVPIAGGGTGGGWKVSKVVVKAVAGGWENQGHGLASQNRR